MERGTCQPVYSLSSLSESGGSGSGVQEACADTARTAASTAASVIVVVVVVVVGAGEYLPGVQVEEEFQRRDQAHPCGAARMEWLGEHVAHAIECGPESHVEQLVGERVTRRVA